MTYSMTGFAQADGKFNNKEISVEVRSLNSKYLDQRIKIPFLYRNKEYDIRRIVQSLAKRGKIELTVNLNGMSESESYTINQELFRKFYHQLYALRNELSIQHSDIMQSILRIPNVIAVDNDQLTSEEWNVVQDLIKRAIERLNVTRKNEGKILEDDMRNRIHEIERLLVEVHPLEKLRIEKLKSNLEKDLQQISEFHPIDKNRFEQEVIYYLDKLDIAEEKVRLKQHCEYFVEILDSELEVKGKKLSFVCQEIGREINTLGAKAQSSDIQRLVVNMKDQLEKIKEQLANVQ